MSFQAAQNLCEHLSLLRDRPLIASMNWHWNRAVVVLCQEQRLADYPTDRHRPNIGHFTQDFTAILGEVEIEFADDESVVAIVMAWVADHGHAGKIEFHQDLRPGASAGLHGVIERSPLTSRWSVVASPRRARRAAVWSAIAERLELAMHEFRLVVHPTRAAGLAAELREAFDPGRRSGGSAAATRCAMPFLDALSPYIEHRFVRRAGARDVDL